LIVLVESNVNTPTAVEIKAGIEIPPRKIERWAAKQPDKPWRPEAIRRLLEQALAHPTDDKPAKKRKAQKASELADRAAEHIVNKSMPVEEQQRRKRALIKGPKEFRDIREDLPKPKT
jgi:hypothetical protein